MALGRLTEGPDHAGASAAGAVERHEERTR